jgi:O-antigen/teichoic acid export membrane protein
MSTFIQKTVHGVLNVGAAHFVIAISAYLIAVVLARTLGPANFGIYGLIYALLTATELIVQVGVPVAVSKLIAERPREEGVFASTGLVVVLLCYGIIGASAWIGAPALARAFNIPDAAPLFRIAALDLPFYGAFLLFENVLSGRRDFQGKGIALLCYGMTKALGVLVLAQLGITIASALYVNVAASVAGLIVVLARSRPRLRVPRRAAAHIMLRLALPVATLDLGLQSLLNIDLWSMSLFSHAISPTSLGQYVAAKSLARIPMVIAFVLNGILIPSLAHGMATGDRSVALRALNGTMRFLILALLPSCTLVAIEAAGLMTLLYSEQYAPGGEYLALLIFGNGLLYTVFSILMSILLAIGQHKAAAHIALVALAPAIIANAVLVPHFGAAGAAYATIVAAAAAVLMVGIAIWRQLGSLIEPAMLLKALLLTAVLGTCAIAIQLSGVYILVEMAGLMILFILASYWIGLIDRRFVVLLLQKTA